MQYWSALKTAAAATKRQFRSRRKRDNSIAACLIIGIISFCVSRKKSAMQVFICFWLLANGVPKRVIAVLNHLGVSVRHEVELIAMKAIGQTQLALLRMLVRSGAGIALCWDNIARTHRREEETLTNKRSFQQNTSVFVQMYVNPPPVESSPGWMFSAWAAVEDSTMAGGVGLPRDLMLRSSPNYAALRPDNLVFTESITEYFPKAVSAEIGTIFERFLSAEALATTTLPNPPPLYMIPLSKSTIHPLLLYFLDETTLDRTNRIVDRILRDVGLQKHELHG